MMVQFKNFRTKAALSLLGTILIPILLLAFSGYGSITETRIRSQEKLLVDHLGLGYESFDEWIGTRLSELMLLDGMTDIEEMSTLKGMNGNITKIGKMEIFRINADERNRMGIFDYRGTTALIYFPQKNSEVWIGIASTRYPIFYIERVTESVFHDKLKKIGFKYPLFQFIEVGGEILYQTDRSVLVDLSVFGNEKQAFVKSDQGDGMKASYYRHSERTKLGIGCVEDYGRYLEDIQAQTRSFTTYTILLVLLSIMAILLIANRIKLPIQKLKNAVGSIMEGDLDVTIAVSEGDDFKDLYQLFNEMILMDQKHIEDLEKAQTNLLKNNSETLEINAKLADTIRQMEEVNEKMRNTDGQLSTLLDSVKDIIFRIDREGHLIYANRALCDLMKWKDGEWPSTLEVVELEGKNINFNVMMRIRADSKNQVITFRLPNGNPSEEYSIAMQRIYSKDEIVALQAICKTVRGSYIIQDRLEKRNKELEFLKEINTALSNNSDLNELLQTISLKIDHLVGTTICTIRLFNNVGELALKSSSGQFRHLVRKGDVDPANDPSGRALREKRIIVLRAQESYEFLSSQELEPLKKKVLEIVFIPLVIEGRQLGVISVGMDREVRESDIQLLDAFSYQAAIAIDKANLYDKLKHEYLNTIKALATAVEAKDEYTEGHSLRVSKLSCLIGKYMGIREEALDEIEISGLLHDIGKIGIRDAILTKPGQLSDAEFDEIRKHPSIGYKIVAPIGLSKPIIDGILYHHKKFDLTGYPEDEHLVELPLVSRIIGVADAFDAMTSNRSYTKKRDLHGAIDEIKRFSGSQFCPVVVDALEKIRIHAPEALREISNSD